MPVPAQAVEYTPRKPQDPLLHRLVREHYATFVAHAEATYAAPLPRYVNDAFERYLACGDFSQGFVRCHCDACRHDVLVAFSCKQRGLCPSCGARRMCDVAANVTDCILPNAPLRQWVLSLPFELRGLAATKPDVLTALGRIFAEEVACTTKRPRLAAPARRRARRFQDTSSTRSSIILAAETWPEAFCAVTARAASTTCSRGAGAGQGRRRRGRKARA